MMLYLYPVYNKEGEAGKLSFLKTAIIIFTYCMCRHVHQSTHMEVSGQLFLRFWFYFSLSLQTRFHIAQTGLELTTELNWP